MKREAKQLLGKLIILLSIVAIAWVATASGLTEKKVVAFGDYIVGLYEQTENPEPTPKPSPVPKPIPNSKPRPKSLLTLPILQQMEISEVERMAFDLINLERARNGLQATKWDEGLYELSKAHTEKMADKGELFHTQMGESYAENVWGASWGKTRRGNIAEAMVSGWMSSPLHRAWILHKPLRTSALSVVDDDRGNFASWTFRFTGDGPPLVKKAYNLWMSETGGKTPWLIWLHDIKGYPDNTAFLE